MGLEVIPLSCGRLEGVEQSRLQYLTGFGNAIEVETFVWLITGGEFPVVVDIGPGSPGTVKERIGRDFHQTEAQSPRNAVAAAGIDPDEVRVVIQTHLHFDHTLSFCDDPFPNATIYIQQSELQYAAAPYPPHRGMYDAVDIKNLLPVAASSIPNVEVVDGDFTVMDGVRALLTPGHSPGLQSVLVEGREQVYAIASDNVPLASSWTGSTMENWIPSGVHVSLDDCYRSMHRVGELADVVLPSHDAVVLSGGPYA